MTEDVRERFSPTAEKRRILIVEDESVNRELLKLCLEGSYEVVEAAAGREALDTVSAQSEALSLILLDLRLPDMHGFEILRRLRDEPRTARLPVIVMTSDSEAEVECLTLGAIDFIPKPYPRQEIVLARVRRTIELFEDRDTLRWTERDHLTGLYNKEFFYRYAVQLDALRRDFPTDAIVIDINHFHSINDRYGKARGDELLRRIAGKLIEAVSTSGGLACRSGADTFLIYCPHRADYAALLEQVSVSPESGENRVRLRVGVAFSDLMPERDVFRDADTALQRQKQLGKPGCTVF